MARTDTLPHFLTDVASAIKTKKGDSTPIQASNFDTAISNIPNIVHPDYISFYGYTGSSLDLSWLRTDNMTAFKSLFYGCSYLTSLDLRNFDVSNVGTTEKMFNNCKALTSITGSKGIIKNNVASTADMFNTCNALTSLDLSESNLTGVTKLNNMFKGCTNLASITFPNSSVSSEITNCNYLFQNCTSLTELDLTTVLNTTHTSNGNSEGIFDGCTSLQTIKIPNFKLDSSFNTWRYVFRNCTSLQYLDVRNIDFSGLFIAQTFLNVPNDCLILVKDAPSKNAILSSFSNLTNIQIASEYEANQ